MYVLLHNNQMKVGPRVWSHGMFMRYLDEVRLNHLSVPVTYESDEPLIISDVYDIKIFRVQLGTVEPINSKIEQQAGPFYEWHSDHIVANYGKAPKPVDAVKYELKAKINERRIVLEKNGLSYQFPDSVGVIQTRDDTDIRNIQSVTTTSLILKSQNIDSPVISFRDEGDVTHMLTPDQAIEMGLAVQSFIAGVYQWAWDAKANIDACTTLEELDAINLDGE